MADPSEAVSASVAPRAPLERARSGSVWPARVTRALAVFGLVVAIAGVALAAWTPRGLTKNPVWIELLGFTWLFQTEPGVSYRPEMRAGLAQVGLAGLLLFAAASSIAAWRRARPDPTPGSSSASGWLESPAFVALLFYVALWIHVVWPLKLAIGASPLLIEQHVDSHSYVHQAAAWLRGEQHVTRVLHDRLVVGGKNYIVFPPFPALVLLPFVALFRHPTKTLLNTPLLGASTAYASMRTLTRCAVPPAAAVWCTAGLIFGSPLLLLSGRDIDAYFAHCCALACVMAALCELTGRSRPWLIGLLLGGAALSRQLSILLVPFFLVAAAAPDRLLPRPPSHTPRNVRARPSPPSAWAASARSVILRSSGLLLSLAVCLGAYALLNWIRSGNPLDTGYSSLVEHGWYKYRASTYGDFSWVYLPSNVLRLFVLGIVLQFERGSYMLPQFTGFGSSLTFTSPFLYFALRDLFSRSAPWPSRSLRALAWLCIAAVTAGVLLHKSALGGYQIHGQRYTLDFTPLLFLLAAIEIGRVWTQPLGLLARWLIGYSIVASVLMVNIMPGVIALSQSWPR